MNSSDRVTIFDRFLAKSFLLLIPRSVTPNHVTLFRFAAIPFVLFLLLSGEHFLGGVLFVIAALSDAVDGALARTRNQVTEWGMIYDPLADKFLILSVALILVPKFLGVTLVVLLVAVELLLVISAYFYHQRNPNARIAANSIGKWKMALQSVGVGLVILFLLWPSISLLIIAQYLLYASVLLAAVNLAVYGSL